MPTTNQSYHPQSLRASNFHHSQSAARHHQPAAPPFTKYPLLPSRPQSPFTDGTLSPFSQPCPPQSYHCHPTFSFQPLQPASRPHSPFVNKQPPSRPQPLLVGRSHTPVPPRVHNGPSATHIPHHVQYSLPPSMNRNGPLEILTEPNTSLQQINNFNFQGESGTYVCMYAN